MGNVFDEKTSVMNMKKIYMILIMANHHIEIASPLSIKLVLM